MPDPIVDHRFLTLLGCVVFRRYDELQDRGHSIEATVILDSLLRQTGLSLTSAEREAFWSGNYWPTRRLG